MRNRSGGGRAIERLHETLRLPREATDQSCPRRASRRPSGWDAQAQDAAAPETAADSACQTSPPVYRCTTRATTHARTSTTNSTAPTRNTAISVLSWRRFSSALRPMCRARSRSIRWSASGSPSAGSRYVAMNWSGANENSQSRRGHSTDSTAKPSSAKQPIAIHAAALMSCFTSVWPPKKDVVMAAAAISAPARARSSRPISPDPPIPFWPRGRQAHSRREKPQPQTCS